VAAPAQELEALVREELRGPVSQPRAERLWLLRENPGVPLETPQIDERDYAQLLDEIVRRFPVHNPEWTDFNQSDPGVTLLELFAFLADTLLWQLDERQRQHRHRRRRRLAVVIVGTGGLGALWWTWKKRASYQRSGRSMGGSSSLV